MWSFREKYIPGVKRLLTFRELLPDAPVLQGPPVQVSPGFTWGGHPMVWFSDGSLRHERAKARGKSVRRVWKRQRQEARA